MSRRTLAGARVQLHHAQNLGKISARQEQKASKAAAAMTDRKLKRHLCGAECNTCRGCEYGVEWLRRLKKNEA